VNYSTLPFSPKIRVIGSARGSTGYRIQVKTMWNTKYISSLKPRDSHYSEREEGSTGFSIKVYPSGKKTFLYLKTIQGKRKQISLGSFPAISLLEARQKYRELIGRSVEREEVAEEVAQVKPSLTLIEAWRLFENSKGKTLSSGTIKNYGNIIYDISNLYSPLLISSLDRRLVKEYLTGIESQPSKHNTAMATISKIAKFLIIKGLLETNPVRDIEKLPVSHKTRKLSLSELKVFMKALARNPMASYNRDIILFILLTGARASEASELPIEELDLKAGRWILNASRSKNKKENLIPLNQAVIDLLRRHIGERKTGSVFTNKNGKPVKRGAPRQSMVRLLEQLEIPSASLHDLRRTFAHHMNSIGIPSSLISEILNHSKSDITNTVYIQAGVFDGENEKRHALNQWTGTLLEFSGL
jgi:integrase